jgi:hypothetical protein
MRRDTAVITRDKHLFTQYTQLIHKLQQQDGVLNCADVRFSEKLREYERMHRKIVGQSLENISDLSEAKHPIRDFTSWVKDDRVQILPIFIWDGFMTEREEILFKEKVEPLITHNNSSVELIGLYEGSKNDQRYYNGDIVLTLKNNGAYAEFKKVDIVLYAESKWWLCTYSFTKFKEPFVLTKEVKSAIKARVCDWTNAGKQYLTTNDLLKIAVELVKNH